MRCLAAGLGIFTIFLSGCAYIGEPLPPALKIPVPTQDLAAVQRGDKIYVEFTTPAVSTEGITLKPPAVPEVRIGEAEPPTTLVEKVTSVTPWVGKEVTVGVAFRGPSGRLSEWSNFVKLKITPPVETPADLSANAVASGVELQWKGSAPAYRVLRDGELIGTAEVSSYIDKTAQYGQKYTYTIQGTNGQAESEISKPAEITPEDKFAPETPSGVVALAGVSTVEVSWTRSLASDFAFYRVYRDGKKIADNVTATTYSDKDVQSGKKYSYTVSAVDAKMNESAPSAPVEITFP